MATSGSRNWIATRDNIIYAALRKLGVKEKENPPEPEEVQEAAFALNAMVMSWQNDGVNLWNQSEDFMLLTADTLSVALDASILEIQNPFFRRDDSDDPLYVMTREEYLAITDKKESGDPFSIYTDYQLANPTSYLWPVPNNTTSMVVGTDALYYLCIKDHTSAAASRPITGADYATYWQAVSTTTANAWVTATDYYSDIIRYSKVQRLQDFDVAADNPDFPVRWMQALIYGLASQLAPEYHASPAKSQEMAGRFKGEYLLAKRWDFDATDLRVVPARR